jgi:F420-0:gamma-glutamyl ligase-like protein
MIIDTDATYQLGGTKFTSIPLAMPGIKKDLGVFGYLMGRLGKIMGPTPLAVSIEMDVDRAIAIAKLVEDYHKENDLIMETVYDMRDVFNQNLEEVTIEMLESIEHTPAVLVKEII